MRLTRTRLGVGLAAGLTVAVCAVAYLAWVRHTPPDPARAPLPADEDSLPVQLTDDGWRLTRDCTLSIESPAFVQTSPTGKFITAPSVGLVPTNRAGPTYTVRPANGSEVRIYFAPVPLRVSKTIPLAEGKQMLTENDETELPVTTLVIREGTRIMPEQRVEIVDRGGNVVWKAKG